jgi:hypothetical protein
MNLTWDLERMHPSHRTLAIKYLKIILDKLTIDPKEGVIPTLDEVYQMIGKASTKLAFMERVVKLITQALGYSFEMWPKDLMALRNNCRGQLELLNKMAETILYKEAANEPQKL